jgi:hypothetical protein
VVLEGKGGDAAINGFVFPTLSWSLSIPKVDFIPYTSTRDETRRTFEDLKNVEIAIDYSKSAERMVGLFPLVVLARGIQPTRTGECWVRGFKFTPDTPAGVAYFKRLYRRAKRKPRMRMLNRRK